MVRIPTVWANRMLTGPGWQWRKREAYHISGSGFKDLKSAVVISGTRFSKNEIAVKKIDSQAKNKKEHRDGESGNVAPLSLQKQITDGHQVKKNDLDTLQDDELRKDLELLARMRERIDHLPEIDTARIVQIHEQIMRGEYRVSSERLAEKLGRFEMDIQDSSSN